jgi:hypothetical protein
MLAQQSQTVHDGLKAQVSDDSGSENQSTGAIVRLHQPCQRHCAFVLQPMQEGQDSGGIRRVKNIFSDESDSDVSAAGQESVTILMSPVNFNSDEFGEILGLFTHMPCMHAKHSIKHMDYCSRMHERVHPEDKNSEMM